MREWKGGGCTVAGLGWVGGKVGVEGWGVQVAFRAYLVLQALFFLGEMAVLPVA